MLRSKYGAPGLNFNGVPIQARCTRQLKRPSPKTQRQRLLSFCKVEPLQNDKRRCLWVLGEGRFNCRVQRAWIGTPLKFNPGAPYFDRNIFWRYSQHLIKSRNRFFVASQGLIRKGDLLEYGEIVRV